MPSFICFGGYQGSGAHGHSEAESSGPDKACARGLCRRGVPGGEAAGNGIGIDYRQP